MMMFMLTQFSAGCLAHLGWPQNTAVLGSKGLLGLWSLTKAICGQQI